MEEKNVNFVSIPQEQYELLVMDHAAIGILRSAYMSMIEYDVRTVMQGIFGPENAYKDGRKNAE